MSPLQIMSSLFGALSLLLVAMKPELETSLVVVSAFALLGAVTFLESAKDDQLEELKIEVKKIKDTTQALMVRAGLGR